MFIVLAFIGATSFPMGAFAMIAHGAVKAEKSVDLKVSDCHKHAKANNLNNANNADMCECIGGNCHNFLAQIFGADSESIIRFTASKSSFRARNEVMESALAQRLKRPPKV